MNLKKYFSDAVDLIKKGIENRDQIIEAFQVSVALKNKDWENIPVEALAEVAVRKEICKSCSYNSKNAKKGYSEPGSDEIKKYESAIPFEHCIFCSCRIGGDNTKEYCLSCNCGISVWNIQNPDKQIELKWKSFDIKENNYDTRNEEKQANAGDSANIS